MTGKPLRPASSPAKTVLISGASIAGPPLAYWLKQAGFKPTLVERAPAPRPGGQAIDVRGKALSILEQMGLLKRAQQLRTQRKGVSLQDADGNEIWRSDEETFSGGRFDNDDIELLRDDLAGLLLEDISDAEIFYGASIQTLRQNDGGVEVTLSNGMNGSYDLVVGADGVHSKVGALAFGEESPYLKSLDAGLAVFSTPNILGLKDWQIAFREDEGDYLLYPVRDNSELRIALGFKASLSDEQRGDIQTQKTLVAQRCANFKWEIPKILEHMETAPDFYFGVMTQACMDRWTNGRVALIGDAGYCPSPFSGQGTSLALVGAYVLAQELSRSPEDYQASYLRYKNRMRPYVLLNQALANRDRNEPVSEEALTEAKNAIDLA